MQVIPYLNFDGRCAEAFRFYEQLLGGKVEEMMTFGQSPMASQTAPEWRDKVMHARLVVDGQVLMGSDSPPEQYQRPQGVSVTLSVDDPAEAERIFQALAENGSVSMPIQKTFWADRFGMLVDRFGTPWMVNCDQSAREQAA